MKLLMLLLLISCLGEPVFKVGDCIVNDSGIGGRIISVSNGRYVIAHHRIVSLPISHGDSSYAKLECDNAEWE